MIKLFQSIETALALLHEWGWCSPQKAYSLASAVIALQPETIVEVGVFAGKSLFPMALACQAVGKGKVIGVDPWVSAASVQGQVVEADRQFWNQVDHEQVYQKFLEIRTIFGLQDVIKIERMISEYFEPPKQIGVLHVDGNHGEQAFRDVQRIAPSVLVGGFCFLDDLDWSGGAVRKGESWLLANGFVRLWQVENGAMFQRLR